MNLSIGIRSFLFFENLLCLGGYFILLAYIYDSQISEAWQYWGLLIISHLINSYYVFWQ